MKEKFGRTYDRKNIKDRSGPSAAFPLWAALGFMVVVFGAIFGLAVVKIAESAQKESKPVPTLTSNLEKHGDADIVVIDILLESDYNGRQVFVLKYAIDGYTDSVMLYDPKKLEQYLDHLRTLGDVTFLDDVPELEGVEP